MNIAIPSFRRADLLVRSTLTELRRLHADESSIRVFLSDPAERETYAEALRAAGFPTIRLVDGALGVGPNRNLIHHYYPDGEEVLCLDDDVRQVVIKQNDQLMKLMERDEFDEFVGDGFAAAAGGLWGIHPVANPYFQRFKISRDLRYIAANFYGFVSRADPSLDVVLEDKEDFERSIRWYLADGYVTRLNWIAVRANYYTAPGGMQETRTRERVLWSAEEIVRRWPELATLNLSKKSGWAEVRLRDRRPLEEAS